MDPAKAYPDTLRKAFEQASKHIVMSDTNEIVSATAFVASHKVGGGGGAAKEHRKAEEDATRKKAADKPRHKTPKSNKGERDATTKSKRSPSRPCSLCSEMHWTNDCPFQKEVQEIIKRSKDSTPKKAEKESVLLTRSSAFADPDSVDIDGDSELHSAYITESLPLNKQTLPPTCVQLDTQASNHLFKNKDLLKNHRPLARPIIFRGVEKKGKGLYVTMCGDFEEWKGVPYHNDSTANLLSLSKTKDSGI